MAVLFPLGVAVCFQPHQWWGPLAAGPVHNTCPPEGSVSGVMSQCLYGGDRGIHRTFWYEWIKGGEEDWKPCWAANPAVHLGRSASERSVERVLATLFEGNIGRLWLTTVLSFHVSSQPPNHLEVSTIIIIIMKEFIVRLLSVTTNIGTLRCQ